MFWKKVVGRPGCLASPDEWLVVSEEAAPNTEQELADLYAIRAKKSCSHCEWSKEVLSTGRVVWVTVLPVRPHHRLLVQVNRPWTE